LRARYMDPSVGQFSQMDSWTGSQLNPITLNKYMYGNSDPAAYVDPTGRFSITQTMVAVSALSYTTGMGPSYLSSFATLLTDADDFDARYNQSGKYGMLIDDFKASVPTAYLMGEALNATGYINKVRPYGSWDYKNKFLFRSLPEDIVAAFGNFAFGTTCSAWQHGARKGIVRRLTRIGTGCIRGAGLVQEYFQSSKYDSSFGHFYEIWSDRTGDQPVDSTHIWFGINYYHRKQSVLLESIM